MSQDMTSKPLTCQICDWAIVGKPLHPLHNKKNLVVLWVCDYCYRGFYGFRYNKDYLYKAYDFLLSYSDVNFMERRRENG